MSNGKTIHEILSVSHATGENSPVTWHGTCYDVYGTVRKLFQQTVSILTYLFMEERILCIKLQWALCETSRLSTQAECLPWDFRWTASSRWLVIADARLTGMKLSPDRLDRYWDELSMNFMSADNWSMNQLSSSLLTRQPILNTKKKGWGRNSDSVNQGHSQCNNKWFPTFVCFILSSLNQAAISILGELEIPQNSCPFVGATRNALDRDI